MRKLLFVTLLFVVVNVPAPAQIQPLGLKHATFVVKLTSPISTNTASPGDTFAALVEAPTEYQGAVLVGRITKLKKPKKGVGKGKHFVAQQIERHPGSRSCGSRDKQILPVKSDCLGGLTRDPQAAVGALRYPRGGAATC